MCERRLALLTAFSAGETEAHGEIMAEVGSEARLGHGPLCPCTPEAGAGSVGRWSEEEAAFAAELLLTSQTLLFASVGSLPLFVPDNLFFCLLTYI